MQTFDFADLLGPMFGGMSFSFGFDDSDGKGMGFPKFAKVGKGRSKNKGYMSTA